MLSPEIHREKLPQKKGCYSFASPVEYALRYKFDASASLLHPIQSYVQVPVSSSQKVWTALRPFPYEGIQMEREAFYRPQDLHYNRNRFFLLHLQKHKIHSYS